MNQKGKCYQLNFTEHIHFRDVKIGLEGWEDLSPSSIKKAVFDHYFETASWAGEREFCG